jgi:hypothetical protein
MWNFEKSREEVNTLSALSGVSSDVILRFLVARGLNQSNPEIRVGVWSRNEPTFSGSGGWSFSNS